MKTTIRTLAILALAGPPLRAAVVAMHPIADTTLQEAFPNNNQGDGTSFQAGGRRQGGRARGLFLFDVPGNVPAGATINSVTLSLSVVGVPSGGVNSIFDLHSVLQSWGEGNGSDHGGSPGGAGQVTWNNRLGAGTAWTSAGGSFSPIVSGSRSISGLGSVSFSSTAQMVSDVQSWLNTPANNFGWELISESELSPTSIRRFASRDDVANSPTLSINFTPVPEPGTFAFWSLGGLSLWLVSRRRLAWLETAWVAIKGWADTLRQW